MWFKKHWKKLISVLAFVVIALLLAGLCTRILTPKFLTDQTWADTSTYVNFYEQEEGSIDVIFLGSSHATAGFSPDVLEEECGIFAYNLGGSEQSLVISYYWLLEALRFQSPKAVVLDVNMLFSYRDNLLNSTESSVRKALDYMRWSSVKASAVSDVCKYDDDQSLISYYIPLCRYHSRWSELEANDFIWNLADFDPDYNGHSALTDVSGDTEWQPLSLSFAGADDTSAGAAADASSADVTADDASDVSADAETSADILELMEEYLRKISDVCDENGIELILVSLPYGEATVERYNAVNNLADDLGVSYLDFSVEEVYNATGLVYADDMADSVHLNESGAAKVTAYLGKVISEAMR